MPSNQHIRDGTMLPVEDLSNRRDDYIRWYQDITRVYIGNSANHDTCTVRYQPARVNRRMMTFMLQKVDDMAIWVIKGPPSSPTQITSFAKKVKTIIRRCMVSIGADISSATIASSSPRARIGRGAREVKRGTRRAPLPRDLGLSSFQAPPPPGTVGSSTPHMPISYASLSDLDEHDDERMDDVIPAQQLGFSHRVGKKTTRFTPSD
ncbi:hypothetical protein M9H77_34521 [Catharanthus roseus]|uniref:Uncharacterized protein n=1 Tax=Catharanthus roseus TaxID=4058 RepID=A0ACB9ZLG1_CATRO|nr:hypothetical protein M9H77_34521 [Catharanthus roseus]